MEIITVRIEAVLMPNGEIISVGKTLGTLDEFTGFITDASTGNPIKYETLQKYLCNA